MSDIVLTDDTSIPSRTLVWTAGTVPNPLVSSLPCAKERGRLLVDEFLRVPDWPDVWAVGDCTFVPDTRNPGKSHPPTAQHAIREGQVVAQNIAAVLVGSSFEIIFIQDYRAARFNRSQHGRSAHFRFQFLRLLCVVAVADDLPEQVARLGQKDSCSI